MLYFFFFLFFPVLLLLKLGSSSSQKKTLFHKIVNKYKHRKEKSSAADKGDTPTAIRNCSDISFILCSDSKSVCTSVGNCACVVLVVVYPWFCPVCLSISCRIAGNAVISRSLYTLVILKGHM